MSGGSKTEESTSALRMNGDSGHQLKKNGSHEDGSEMKSQQIHRSYSNAENRDGGNTDDPMMVTSGMGNLDSPDDGTGYSKSPNSKKQEMERLKHKAIRPSVRMANGSSSVVPPVMNGTSTTGIWQPRFMTVKKYSKNSRRPRGRYGRGLPKKGGAGGKGTWGAPGSELVDVEHAVGNVDDPHDPNYDSDSQDNCKFEAITPPLNDDEIEKHVGPIIAEYFENGDLEEVVFGLEELNLNNNEYQVLIVAVTLAMERKSFHREMTSVLISEFYNRVFSEAEIERGFEVLLRSLPELVLDTPGAPTILGNFIARAVADDCVPPAFVARFLDGVGSGGSDVSESDQVHIRSCIEHASALLNMKGGLVKLDTVWGVTGGMRPVKYLVRQIQLLLKEYVSSGELEEAVRCLQELEVPHFHHELVYEALLMALEDPAEKTSDLVVSLLRSLSDSAIVTLDQLRNGFNRIYTELDDITLDIPLAYTHLERIVSRAANFIPRDLIVNCPSRGRKRFVSEGDGGRIKDE